MPGQSTSVMMSAGSAFIKVIGLMFYQPNKEATIAGLASRVHAILGETGVRGVKFLEQEEVETRRHCFVEDEKVVV
jgi:hypothetical protein